MTAPERKAFAVILGGGAGTRLWPSSRRARPKQLLSLGAPESLIASAVRRGRAIVGLENTLVVTAADQADALRAALPDLPADNVVVEPVPRNTAAAVGLGAVTAQRRAGPDAVIAVLPADPYIADEPTFERLVRPGDRRGARHHRHHRRDADPRRDRLRLHPPGRAPAARRRGRRARRRRLLREARPPDRRALRRVGRVPVELGDVLPHRAAHAGGSAAAPARAGRAARRGGRRAPIPRR